MCGVGVGVPAPFYVCSGLLFQRAQADHVHWGKGVRYGHLHIQHCPPPDAGESPKLTLQLKARPNLGQLHIAVVGLLVYMVPGAKGAGLSGGREQLQDKQQTVQGHKGWDVT